MAVVARGVVTGTEESHWESASRGPQTEIVATFQQAGQEKPLRVTVGHKCVADVEAAVKAAKPVDLALYLDARTGKNRPWTKLVVVGCSAV